MSQQLLNIISPKKTIKSALKLLDQCAEKLLLILDNNNVLLGTLSDGDIRRALLKGSALSDSIDDYYNKNYISLNINYFTIENAINICKQKSILGLPIIDNKNKLIDYFSYYKDQSFIKKVTGTVSIPVIIMGGGKGTRMKPISDVFPKPLIPLNGKPMIDHVIDYFKSYNIYKYFLTLNYKSDLMISYFNSIEKDYAIDFAIEPSYMGTAGSIKLLEDKLPEEFIISNCDCIANTNLTDVIKQHQEKKSILTVICSIKHHKIPYGKINYKNGGSITGIEEKPELSIPINTGVYVANKQILDFIEKDKLFHMTHLIETLIQKKLPVHCFFINEKEFVDFGQWKEYKNSIDLLK